MAKTAKKEIQAGDSRSLDDLFAPASPPQEPREDGARTILLAEDDERLRKLIASVIREEGFRVEEAGDGEDALQRAMQIQVDLVIADLMMPRMNSWRLLSSLREKKMDVPVIILTGHMSEEGERVLTSKDIVGYVTKPIDFDALKKMIGSVFADQPDDRTYKILADDDDETTRELVVSCLEKSGFDVRTVSRGADVLVEIEKFNPDLLVLDLMMPDMNGFEVCRELRNNPEYGRAANLPSNGEILARVRQKGSRSERERIRSQAIQV